LIVAAEAGVEVILFRDSGSRGNLVARGLMKFEWMPVSFVKRQEFLTDSIQLLLTNMRFAPLPAAAVGAPRTVLFLWFYRNFKAF
jgi:hypothetical protein